MIDRRSIKYKNSLEASIILTATTVDSTISDKMLQLLIAVLLIATSPAFASITCLKVGSTATAKWVDGSGKSCSWTGVVGSNFGVNAANQGT